ncbi:MAG: hypothetical protein U5L96_18685 [Owenweeksia sp.]|nr:hypothetical protein [Owenweeksia sp.]
MFRISYLLLLFIGCSSLSAQIVNIESLRSFTDTVGLHGEENFNIGYTRNTRELTRYNKQFEPKV